MNMIVKEVVIKHQYITHSFDVHTVLDSDTPVEFTLPKDFHPSQGIDDDFPRISHLPVSLVNRKDRSYRGDAQSAAERILRNAVKAYIDKEKHAVIVRKNPAFRLGKKRQALLDKYPTAILIIKSYNDVE